MILVSIKDVRDGELASFHTRSSLNYKAGEFIYLEIQNRAPTIWTEEKEMERTKFEIMRVDHEVSKIFTASHERPTMEALSMTVLVKRIVL